MNGTKPEPITTPRYWRSLIVAGILIIALIAGVGFLISSNAPKPDEGSTSFTSSIFTPQDKEPTITGVQEETETINTPQHAKEFIVSYYKALFEKNTKALRDMGAVSAANALEHQWTDAIDFRIDLARLEHPDTEVFPPSQGLYAGCTIYRISDFYSTAPVDAVYSKIVGMTGAEGWIYYDPVNAKWIIADPTIPTAFAAPQAENIEKTSSDKLATARMSCAGVYSNAWWAWAICEVQITSTSTDTPVSISAAEFDDGFTVSIGKQLLGSNIKADAASSVVVKDVCTMWRGVTGNFNKEKIGARPLEVDGNICPVVAAYGNEDISPVFAVGKSDSYDIATQTGEQQIEDFGATNDFENTVSDGENTDGEQ